MATLYYDDVTHDPSKTKAPCQGSPHPWPSRAIERALDSEAGCDQIMHLIAGTRGAMTGLMAGVVEEHVRTHLVDADKHPKALNTEAAEQLLDVVRTYFK